MPQAGIFDKQFFLRVALGSTGGFNQHPGLGVAASQTINQYDIVSIASGVVSQAIALPGSNNSGSLSGGALSTIGIAMDSFTANSSGVDTTGPYNKTTIPVALWDNNIELITRAWNATGSNTPLTNYTLGNQYQIGRYRGANSSTWWYYISQTTTNGEVQYCEQYGINDQLTTDLYPLLIVRSVSTYRQMG